jgi:hypothetical protein
MDYQDVVDGMFAARPAGTPLPAAVTSGGSARRLRDAAEPVAMHAVWNRSTNEALAALGLDFLGAYIAGRATALGRPGGAVVAAAFAWFEPAMVSGLYDTATATVPLDRLVAVRDATTTASLRSVLGDDDPTEVADLLADAAISADGTGRPLFAGLRGRGRPADPVQRLWWAADLVREHRGDSHVAVANAAGLGPVAMNILTERWLGMPLYSYTGSRGWAPEVMTAGAAALEARGWLADDALTTAGRTFRAELEARTDAQEQAIVDAMGDRVDEVCARLDGWGTRCIEAGAFPADELKRAAG